MGCHWSRDNICNRETAWFVTSISYKKVIKNSFERKVNVDKVFKCSQEEGTGERHWSKQIKKQEQSQLSQWQSRKTAMWTFFLYNFSLFSEVKHFGLKMPKEMINFTLDRKGNEPWGFVIVGGKDQVGIDIDIDDFCTWFFANIDIDLDLENYFRPWQWSLGGSRLTPTPRGPDLRSGIMSGASMGRRLKNYHNDDDGDDDQWSSWWSSWWELSWRWERGTNFNKVLV